MASRFCISPIPSSSSEPQNRRRRNSMGSKKAKSVGSARGTEANLLSKVELLPPEDSVTGTDGGSSADDLFSFDANQPSVTDGESGFFEQLGLDRQVEPARSTSTSRKEL